MEKEKGIKGGEVAKGNVMKLNELEAYEPIESPDKEEEMEEGTDIRLVESIKEELTGVETKAKALVETPKSRHIGRMDHETYKSLPIKSMYNVILKKKLVKKDDIEGYFVIPYSIRGIKYMNALIDQGSDVNVMPISFYNRLADKEPVPALPSELEKSVEDDLDPITPTNTVSAYAITVEVFDPLPSLCIWEVLRGNTLNLDSIWEETGQDYNLTRTGFKDAHTVPGDGVAIPSDAVRTYKRRCQELCDGVRT
ncbi:hypothetical protein Tco_1221112 [Tanacetum coccineum]